MVGAARGDVLEEVEIEMEPYLTTITAITIMSKFEFCLGADPETWILVHIVHLGGPGKRRLSVQREMTSQHPLWTTVLQGLWEALCYMHLGLPHSSARELAEGCWKGMALFPCMSIMPQTLSEQDLAASHRQRVTDGAREKVPVEGARWSGPGGGSQV